MSSPIDQLIHRIEKDKPLWLQLREQMDKIARARDIGITYKAMAEAYGVSEPSFRRALRRARKSATKSQRPINVSSERSIPKPALKNSGLVTTFNGGEK